MSLGIPWQIPFVPAQDIPGIAEEIRKDHLSQTYNLSILLKQLEDISGFIHEIPNSLFPFGNVTSDVLFVLKGYMPAEKASAPFSDAPGYIVRHILRILGISLRNDVYTIALTDSPEDKIATDHELITGISKRFLTVLTLQKPKHVVVFSHDLVGPLEYMLGHKLAIARSSHVVMPEQGLDFMLHVLPSQLDLVGSDESLGVMAKDTYWTTLSNLFRG